MRWKGARQSQHVDDRRGQGLRRPAVLGGGGLLLVLLVGLLLGRDPLQLIQEMGSQEVALEPRAEIGSGHPALPDEPRQFVGAVLGSTEDVWTALFAERGLRYEPPGLVLFDDAVESACGLGHAAVGPFYCPADGRIYLDLSFFRELEQQFDAPGDFAQAYVIAHEVGHHVQNLLGISDAVRRAQSGRGEVEKNALSVGLELQADCLAGIWGHRAAREYQLLEPGDAEEGLAAAAAIGDDRLQRRSAGRVSPESWTHGSSEQRLTWLRRGLERGDADLCDTFGGELEAGLR